MTGDVLNEMPADSVEDLVGALTSMLEIDRATAKDLIRSSEPFWTAMERAGGLVDTWGGGEFCYVLPRVLAFIHEGT
ncbi:hypothetical protein ACFWQC_03090 [Nocardioides sp. NPDC058538]|uniref:hypothetical protein n=1 Tax=Nocardioides sp. NPDC058538 TaxID=3346542 RepID=UPI00364A71B0